MQPTQTLKTSYTLNYLKIYIWQILSIILNLAALFVVLPGIARNKEVYGIYSVCISLTIFLSYADLGFINAGIKYAAEYYARQNKTKEKEVIGFASFVLSIFILIFSIVTGVLAFHPEWLFNNLADNNITTAKCLLGILSLSAPVTIAQRTLQMIFSIRLEDYILQSALIIANTLKILSVFYFFTKSSYNLIGYFFFYQLLNLIAIIVAGIIAEKKYALSFFSLGKSFSFSRQIFNETKKLAFSSLVLTISWILFYELDPYIIARLTNPSTLAIYAVGLTLLSFYRSFFGALFNPFVARFNHLTGMNDIASLRGLYATVIAVMLPFIVFSIVAVFVIAQQFIISWLGVQFQNAAPLARILILCNILGFISYPCAILLTAHQKIRLIYFTGLTMPVIYWVPVLLFYHTAGIKIFAISKLLTFLLAGIFYISYSIKFLQIDVLSFLKNYIMPAIIPVLFIIFFLLTISNLFFTSEKSNLNLLFNLSCVGASILCGFTAYYFLSLPFRNYIKFTVKKLARI